MKWWQKKIRGRTVPFWHTDTPLYSKKFVNLSPEQYDEIKKNALKYANVRLGSAKPIIKNNKAMTEPEKHLREMSPNIPDSVVSQFKNIGVFRFAQSYVDKQVNEILEEVNDSLPSDEEMQYYIDNNYVYSNDEPMLDFQIFYEGMKASRNKIQKSINELKKQ